MWCMKTRWGPKRASPRPRLRRHRGDQQSCCRSGGPICSSLIVTGLIYLPRLPGLGNFAKVWLLAELQLKTFARWPNSIRLQPSLPRPKGARWSTTEPAAAEADEVYGAKFRELTYQAGRQELQGDHRDRSDPGSPGRWVNASVPAELLPVPRFLMPAVVAASRT